MKVLLIGYGDLAQRLTPKIVADGWQVTGLRRRVAGGQWPSAAMIAADSRDPVSLQQALGGVDVAIVTLTPDAFTEAAYRATYMDSARALATAIAALAEKPRYLIWASSTGVYGQDSGEWVDESSATEPTGFSGRCLLAAETIIGALPVPATIVRFSGIYGPGRNRLLDRVRQHGAAPAVPEIWTNRIHSEDCAGVLRHLLTRFNRGIANPDLVLATDCCPATRHQVQTWLARRMGVSADSQRQQIPARGNRRCSNRRLLATGYQFVFPDYRSGYGDLLAMNADSQAPNPAG